MAITAYTGPLIGFGLANTGSSIPSEYNDQRGPSLFDLGQGMLDPRPAYNYDPGNAVTTPTYGFWDNAGLVDAVPAAASSNAIALSQSATANGTLTLSGTGTGVLSGQTLVSPVSGVTYTSLVQIDSTSITNTSNGTSFGTSGTVRIWNPAWMVARNVTITSSVNDSGGAYTVTGFDVYGYKITEQIVGPNATTVQGVKAFKYVQSITSSGTINSTGVYVGFGNTFGMPMKLQSPGYATIWAGAGTSAVAVSVSSGFTFASTRATVTSTTPDVRGTWNSTATGGAAPDGSTYRLNVLVSPSVANLATITSTNFSGLFGATQFTTA